MKLSRKNLEMDLLKKSINFLTPRLLKTLEVREPQTPQARIISRTWDRLDRALALEAQNGLREDANFEKLARAVKRALIFLAEEDNYYARWLGFLLQELSLEVQKYGAEFSFAEALKTGARPSFLTPQEYEAHKEDLIDLALSGYLQRLEDLSPEEVARLREGYYVYRIPGRGRP